MITWTTTDLFLKDSPISHPIFSSLVSSNSFNFGLSSIIEPSQPFSNSFNDICWGFGLLTPASKHKTDFSSSLDIILNAITYLPFFSLRICCFLLTSFTNSESLILVALALISKLLAKSHISDRDNSLSSILKRSGISFGPICTPNCLATSIKDFWEPRITSIEVLNHIQIIKEIKKNP